jgi:branched-chain amino acid transport system substrate-binding protein
VALDVLKRSTDPTDPGAVVEAIKATDLATLVGPVNFAKGPVPKVSPTPVVGGQTVKGDAFPFDLKIRENSHLPEIPGQQLFQARV